MTVDETWASVRNDDPVPFGVRAKTTVSATAHPIVPIQPAARNQPGMRSPDAAPPATRGSQRRAVSPAIASRPAAIHSGTSVQAGVPRRYTVPSWRAKIASHQLVPRTAARSSPPLAGSRRSAGTRRTRPARIGTGASGSAVSFSRNAAANTSPAAIPSPIEPRRTAASPIAR